MRIPAKEFLCFETKLIFFSMSLKVIRIKEFGENLENKHVEN